jgi:hypothetical protein
VSGKRNYTVKRLTFAILRFQVPVISICTLIRFIYVVDPCGYMKTFVQLG